MAQGSAGEKRGEEYLLELLCQPVVALDPLYVVFHHGVGPGDGVLLVRVLECLSDLLRRPWNSSPCRRPLFPANLSRNSWHR